MMVMRNDDVDCFQYMDSIALVLLREAGGVVVDPTTGGKVDFLARSPIGKYNGI